MVEPEQATEAFATRDWAGEGLRRLRCREQPVPHALVVTLVVIMVEELGYAVRLTDNGVEALLALEAGRFDLVITDLRMPSMDGFELLTHLGQRWPDLPAIVLTANEDVSDVIEAVRLGAVNYLLKPATPSSVGSAVERALLTRKRTVVADA